MSYRLTIFLVFAAILVSCSTNLAQEKPRTPGFEFMKIDCNSKAGFRGLSVVDNKTVWISGSQGTVMRSIDGGKTWDDVSVPEADERDFRDIHAFDKNTAVVLNAGTPGVLFRTTDGGKSWRQVYKDDRKEIFFDAMDFWDDQRGIAFGDPIDGRMVIIVTQDGGRTWKELPREKQPGMKEGEGGFAASGTCLICVGKKTVMIGTGSHVEGKKSEKTRLLISNDEGQTWRATEVPIARNQSSGIFSVAVLDKNRWVIVGGDYRQPDSEKSNCALTTDAGKTWQPVNTKTPTGFRSVVVKASGAQTGLCYSAGTNGIDVSIDFGKSWLNLAQIPINTIGVSPDGNRIFTAGPNGNVYLGIRIGN